MRYSLLLLGLLFSCHGASVGMEPVGRRLMEVPRRHPGPSRTISNARPVSSVPPRVVPVPKDHPEEQLNAATNRTVALLRKRAMLMDQVAQVDRQLATERDSKRAALTAKYERELQALDEEAAVLRSASPTGGGGAPHSLRDQIAAAVHHQQQRTSSSSGGGQDVHQDVAHQDVDIDVALTLIDADGDGVISTAEAKSASAGAAVLQIGPSATIGCIAGVVCYLVCRLVAKHLMLRKTSPGRPLVQSRGKSPLGGKPLAIIREEAPPRPPRKKVHGECGPAIAC